MSRSRARRRFTAASIAALFASEAALAFVVEGRVSGPDGSPVVGAMVSFQRGDPIQQTTVFSDEEGRFALHVDRRTDTIWICGTNSDSLIRFAPETRRFTVYPLPTRVTYTREIDFDAEGRVWTSNSNSPTWQVEGGFPRVLRLDPDPDVGPGARIADGAR
jgi:hypothetical protein